MGRASAQEQAVRRSDRVRVTHDGGLLGDATVVRLHRDGTISVVWDQSSSTFDGTMNDMLNPAKDGQRFVSRVDAAVCEPIEHNSK